MVARTGVEHIEGRDVNLDAPSAVVVLDYEEQFVAHLTDLDAVRLFLREGVSGELLVGNRPKAIWQFTRGYFEEAKTTPTLEVLQSEFPSHRFVTEAVAEPHWIIQKLRERFRQGEVQQIIREASALSTEPDKAITLMRSRIQEVEQASSSDGWVFDVNDFSSFRDEYQRSVMEGHYIGKTFGFEEIDKHTGGQRNGHLSILTARPKRMKTWILLESFLQQVTGGGNPILYTLELTPKEIWQRLVCLYSGFPFDKIAKGEMMKSDYDELEWIEREMQKSGRYLIARPPLGERTVASLFQYAEKYDADSLLIDQLSFLEPPKDFYQRPDMAIADIIYGLKNAATRQGFERPVYMAAQINRAGKDDADATTIALSDSVGQGADILLNITRTREMMDSGRLRVGIMESRHCEPEDWDISVTMKIKTEFRILDF